jgi:hypothetical protein
MKHVVTIVAGGGFALALATGMGTQISPAEADAKIASNSQLRGQYTGFNIGGCLTSLDGFDQNNRPTTETRTYSTLFNTNVVFTFDGRGRGTADLLTSVNLIVPGPNAPPVARPGVSSSTASGNFTYSVGPKNTVTVTLTDLEFKSLPALQSSTVIDRIVLEGNFGPSGITLVKTDNAIEILTPSNGSPPFPRICERSFVLLSDHPRF